MSSFFLALLRAITTPGGSSAGELLSARRKSHLLQAEWYARLAKEGEDERRNLRPGQGKPVAVPNTAQRSILSAQYPAPQ